MYFLRDNAGTIAVGIAVFAGLTFIVVRMIANARKGKTACGCGCGNCAKYR
jgi:hypothetical protein